MKKTNVLFHTLVFPFTSHLPAIFFPYFDMSYFDFICQKRKAKRLSLFSAISNRLSITVYLTFLLGSISALNYQQQSAFYPYFRLLAQHHIADSNQPPISGQCAIRQGIGQASSGDACYLLCQWKGANQTPSLSRQMQLTACQLNHIMAIH